MSKELSEFLSDDPIEDAEAPAEDVGRPRDEMGRFAATQTGEEQEPEAPEPVEAVPPTENKLPPETFKGLREEREKRQALERELEALRQQFQANQQPAAPPPSIWEDDEGALQHVKGEAVNEAVQRATLNARLDMSEMLVRQSNPDFEDVKAEFLAMAEQNPALVQQALSDPHPWNKAYQIAKNARTMRELGATDLDTLKAKLREELMAEMQAIPPVARPSVPPTLATQRSVAQRSGPAWSGPTPLSELLG